MLNYLFGRLLKLLPENNDLERVWVLAKLDFKSRYYYHRLGILWALLRPVFELFVYYTIFTTIFKTDLPFFELYLFSGLLLWYLFVEGSSKGINVLLSKRYLIESIQFRKSDLLLSTTLSALLGFVFNFFAFCIISLILGHSIFHSGILYFFLLLLVTLVMIYGVSLLLATCSIYLKDVQHLWDMLLLAGFWITPIVYNEELLMDNMPSMIYLNPMAAITINMHRTLLNGLPLDWNLFTYSFCLSTILLFLGLYIFNKYSHKAAEKF